MVAIVAAPMDFFQSRMLATLEGVAKILINWFELVAVLVIDGRDI